MSNKILARKIETAAKEYVSLFKKEVLPKIKDKIKARDIALKNFKDSDRLETIDKEINELSTQLDLHRKEAAETVNYDSIMSTIVNKKQRIETLREIREELENKVLPTAKKHLDEANKRLSTAAYMIIKEMAEKERPGLISRINDIALKMDAHHDGMILFSQESLGIPTGISNPLLGQQLLGISGMGYCETSD